MSFTYIAPGCDIDAHVALITNDHLTLVAHLTCLKGQRSSQADLKNDSDHIDRAVLHQCFNRFQLGEGEAFALDVSIVGALFDDSLLIESDAEVVLDRCVALVGKFDLATAESVYFFGLKRVHQALSCLIEAGRLDQSALSID